MEESIYSPLDPKRGEFRILTISPAHKQASQPLDCSFLYVSISDQPWPEYETVSYCWGDPRPCMVIRVDGKALTIPSSTYHALWRFTLPGRCRTLWIDAVCINQADDREKAGQISFMGTIYRRSIGNLIYLGEGNESASQAVESICNLMQDIEEETKSIDDLKSLIMPNSIWASAPNKIRSSINVEALELFFSQPWFNRVWVVQEVVLAPRNTAFCGNLVLDFSWVANVATWLYHYHAHDIPRPLYEAPALENVSFMWELIANGHRATSGAFLFGQSSELGASEPRDKIFGMLGLFQTPDGHVPSLLTPDYRKPCAHVFRDATRHTIQDQRHLYVLRFVSHRKGSDLGTEGFPTWVPRFDRRRGHGNDPALMPLGYRKLHGVWDSGDEGLGKDSTDPDVLILHGVVLSRLSQVWPVFKEEDTKSFWFVMLRLIEKDQGYQDRFARALTANVNFRHERLGEEDLRGFDHWLNRIESGPGGTLTGITRLPPNADEALTQATRFHQALLNATNYRCWATTESGLMALVPKIAKAGDIIVSVDASDCPYLFRPNSDENQFLGECYLENNMDGQGLAAQKLEGSPEIVFKIR